MVQNNQSNYETYIKTDISRYTGKWIALCEGKIIIVGTNAKTVYMQAQQIAKNKEVF